MDGMTALTVLPVRPGRRPQTTLVNPHAQIGVDVIPVLQADLVRRAFALPDVEDRPTVVSVPGSRDLWLRDGLPLAHPELARGPSGRGFAHIHPDGSLHAIMEPTRAEEATRAGWTEPHPMAARMGLRGRVKLYSARDSAELDVLFSLIVETYTYWTGRLLDISVRGA